MTLSVKHSFQSSKPDGVDTSIVRPSNWNEEHLITASADTILGAVNAGQVGEIACTAAGRALIDDADAAAQRATLGLVIGTNVQAYDADTDAAWTAWTPTLTAGSGTVTGATITTVATYKTIGKTVFYKFKTTLTSIGSGSPAANFQFSTPSAPISDSAGAGYYINSGHSICASAGTDSKVQCFKYDGSTLWVNGNVFTVAGFYEIA